MQVSRLKSAKANHKHFEQSLYYHHYKTIKLAGSFHVNVELDANWKVMNLDDHRTFSRSVYQPLFA